MLELTISSSAQQTAQRDVLLVASVPAQASIGVLDLTLTNAGTQPILALEMTGVPGLKWVRVADILAELSTNRLEKLVKRANTTGGFMDPEKGFWLNRWVFEVPEIYSYKKLGSCYPVSERTLNGDLINPLYPFGRDEDGGLRLLTNSFGYDIRGLPPFPYEEFLAFRRLFPRRKLPIDLAPDIDCRERVVRLD